MNSNGVRSIAQCSATRGFFTLFYYWSLLNISVAQRASSIHCSCASSSLRRGCSRPPRGQSRLYSSQKPTRVNDATPSPTSSREPPLSIYLRNLMRTMPHSVVVATSTAPSPDRSTPPSFKGMTISSFTTLTLTPTPIITFNIRRPSQTLTAIAESRKFLIHILSATESGARVADAFTRGNGPDVFHNPAFSVLRRQGIEAPLSLDPPLLAAEGITKVLRCELREEQGLVEVGDHALVLGKVLSIIEPAMGHTQHTSAQTGLCYLDRDYRQVGSVIQLPEKDPGTVQ